MIKVKLIRSSYHLEKLLNGIGWQNVLNVQWCGGEWFLVIYKGDNTNETI